MPTALAVPTTTPDPTLPPPALTLRPAPRSLPPCEPEAGEAHGEHTGQGLLPLAFALRNGLAGVPQPVRLRAVGDEDWGPRPTGRGELPDPNEWAGRLVQAVVEVGAGRRPPAQLVRWLQEDLLQDLRRKAALAGRARSSDVAPLVRTVHVCEPDDGVAEVTAVVSRGGRVVAVALRLEGLDGRWLCTALDVLEPGAAYPGVTADALAG